MPKAIHSSRRNEASPQAVLFLPVFFASVVVDVIAVVGVLPTSMTIYSGAAATWALLTGKPGSEVAEQAAFGLAVGFLVGIPLMICAGLALALPRKTTNLRTGTHSHASD